MYSGAPDLAWVPSTRVSTPFSNGASAPASAPAKPVLKGPKLPPPLPPVRQVVMQAASSWRKRHGDWRKHTRFVVDGAGEPETAAAVAVATRETVPPSLPIMPPIVSAAVAPAPEATPEPAPVAAIAEAPAEPAPTAEAPIEPLETAPASAPLELSASVPAPAPVRENVDLGEWDVLLLAGPVGAGKSSVTRALTELLPHGAYVQLEPMRDKNFTSLVSEVVRPHAEDTASRMELWSGQTTEARPKAVEIAKAFVERGLRVVLDDMIESSADLRAYQQELDGLRLAAVAMIPSLEELELRDRLRPTEQQLGKRLVEFRAGMVRQLAEHAELIDTSTGTTEEIVERILTALHE